MRGRRLLYRDGSLVCRHRCAGSATPRWAT
jgi:hypothetical protein